MAIKVQCGCGKAFAAKDELAGKTVKCPGCQKPLKIPAAGAEAATAKAPAPAGAKAAVEAAAPSNPSNDSLFDEIGLAPPVEGTRPCPGCNEPLPLQAILCVKCGYNTRLGRRMMTEREGTVEGGHGAVAQDLLSKAAEIIEGDQAEEKKKTGEGLPWWVYLIVLLMLVALATYMLNRGGDEEESEEGKEAGVVAVEGRYA